MPRKYHQYRKNKAMHILKLKTQEHKKYCNFTAADKLLDSLGGVINDRCGDRMHPGKTAAREHAGNWEGRHYKEDLLGGKHYKEDLLGGKHYKED